MAQTKTVENEIVNKAPHYQGIKIKNESFEAWEIIEAIIAHLNLSPQSSWAIGDALKYVLRCGKKFSDKMATTELLKAKQDLEKAAWYLNKAAFFIEKNT